MNPYKFKKQSPWTPDPEVQNPGGSLLKNLYSILFSKFILSHIMVHVACHDLRSFHNFNLLTNFSFAYKNLYRCALWCFTSMYATLSLLRLKFDKLLMMRIRIASINSLCITIIKWTDDRFAAVQLLLQLQKQFWLLIDLVKKNFLLSILQSLSCCYSNRSFAQSYTRYCLSKQTSL